MARPKIIRFYEQQLPSSLQESHQWLVEYHKNCKKLVEYMTQVAKSTACHSTILCLTLLREHLLSTNQIKVSQTVGLCPEFLCRGELPPGLSTMSKLIS